MVFKILTMSKAIIIFLTRLLTGRVIEDVKIDKENKPRKPAVDTRHKIEFSGYTASVDTIITFCISVLVGYTVLYFLNVRPKYVQIILNYNLLSISASFLLLFIIDNIIPRIAAKAVEWIVDFEWELAWKQWKRISAEK